MHPLLDRMQAAFDAAGADPGDDRPKLMIDGRRIDLTTGTGPLRGRSARLASVNARTFPPIAARLDVDCLSIGEMRGGDLSALAGGRRLTHLCLNWLTRLDDISPIVDFDRLVGLWITDAPRIRDISPIGRLTGLRALVYEGGIWNKNRAQTLKPLAALQKLEVLVLHNLKVDADGLRPIAALKGLKALFVSNQFDTADYAYLAAHLPDTVSESFQAYQTLPSRIGGNDVMVTGRRKPFLDSRKAEDRARLERYAAEFERLKDGFRRGA